MIFTVIVCVSTGVVQNKCLLPARTHAISINNVDNQLDATITIYWYSNQLNMFRAIFCPYSGAQDCFTACGIMHPGCCRPVACNNLGACPILAKEQYTKRHARVCAQLHFNICKETGVQLDKKHWYEYVPKSAETSHTRTP